MLANKIKPLLFDRISDHSFINSFNRGSVIVDAGANRGNFARSIMGKYNFSQLILLEPDPFLSEELLKINHQNQSVKIIQGALGIANLKSAEFYLSSNCEASSLEKDIRRIKGLNELKSVINVQVFSLQDIMGRFCVKKIDLLKLDVEGTEYEILQKLNKKQFDCIDQISVEFHDFIDPSLRLKTIDTVNYLIKLGYAFYNSDIGGGYQDCLFYKRKPRLLFSGYLTMLYRMACFVLRNLKKRLMLSR